MDKDFWNFYISVRSSEQIRVLIDELEYLERLAKDIEQHEDGQADNLNIKVKSCDYGSENAFNISIEY